MAVRVDRTIGELLARVDALVGLDHTVVAFTADHGVAPVPEVQQQRKLPGGRMKQEELFGPIIAALAGKYGEGKWILATAGTSPYLNHPLIAEKGLDPAEVRRVAAVGGRQDTARRARLHARAAAVRRCHARHHRAAHPAGLQPAAIRRPRDRPRRLLAARHGGHHARHALLVRRPHPARADGARHHGRPPITPRSRSTTWRRRWPRLSASRIQVARRAACWPRRWRRAAATRPRGTQ